MIPLASDALAFANPGLADGQRFSAALRSNLKPEAKKVTIHSQRSDIYTRVTGKIVADLERGVRTWLKQWNAEHTAGRITRPLRGNPLVTNKSDLQIFDAFIDLLFKWLALRCG